MSDDDDDDDSPPKPKKHDDSAFLASFADLMSLLVVFFVLLFSMSQIRKESFLAVVESLAGKFNPERVVVQPRPSAEALVPMVIRQPATDLAYLFEILGDRLREDPQVEELMYITRLKDRLVVSILGQDMFEGAGHDLTPLGVQSVSLLTEFMRRVDNRIDVNIHVEPGGADPDLYRNEWEMSLLRGRTVSKAFQERNLGRRVPVVGYGDSRFGDLTRDLPEERRQILANRVDVVFRAHTLDGALGDL